ncbi:hypothetical protein EAF04_003787 [Stromatinia cepivora]|nr:hypothetical protein EAF04_003787 [Stromatinia cepivora]
MQELPRLLSAHDRNQGSRHEWTGKLCSCRRRGKSVFAFFPVLALKTSKCYPVAQLSKLSDGLMPRQWFDQTRGSIGGEEIGEKGMRNEDAHAKGLGDIEYELGKASRRKSMSGEASNSTTSSVGASKGMSSKRVSKLGPVHFGAPGLGDCNGEVVE